ncbi:MAG: hypothetical protein HWE27_18820 [Gammaproteobacteria bacterium]|nr:hypothetical protein [Gammaproteobacteria bacterium]
MRGLILGLAALILVGCGGSSGGSGNGSTEYKILGPTDPVFIGQSMGLAIQTPVSDISSINWSQTAGSTITFLGANRKVIGFDVPQTGSYSFQVTFQTPSDGQQTLNFDFTASDSSEVWVNARLDKKVNAKAKASFNATENLPGDLQSVMWQQISGPTVNPAVTNTLDIDFIAPDVSFDTLVKFRVTATDNLGNQGSDEVWLLIEPETINPDRLLNSGRFENVAFADVYPYRSNSPYASGLRQCVYSNSNANYCDLGTLPYVGNINPMPTIDDIMNRVVVSHDWMGARFQQFLENIDVNGDIRQMLAGTTAVVIAYDVRPSFYWVGTGAIYISPSYFWVTPEERDTVDTTADFRSNFDAELNFRDPWRIVKDNEYATQAYPIELRETRTLVDNQYSVLRVLYHELAHANDFYPPAAWLSFSTNDLTFSYWNDNGAVSDGLNTGFALTSSEMYGLAGVMFFGDTASTQEQAYTPVQVSDFFFPDDATNTYAYSNAREDFAMLTEEYMMGYRHQVRYDQGITGLAPDYVIATAERGRVADADILPRAEFVISAILPSINTTEASATLPSPLTLDSGVNWIDSLVPGFNRAGDYNSPSIKRHPVTTGKDIH